MDLVTPELVLVDPELAQRARAALRVPPPDVVPAPRKVQGLERSDEGHRRPAVPLLSTLAFLGVASFLATAGATVLAHGFGNSDASATPEQPTAPRSTLNDTARAHTANAALRAARESAQHNAAVSALAAAAVATERRGGGTPTGAAESRALEPPKRGARDQITQETTRRRGVGAAQSTSTAVAAPVPAAPSPGARVADASAPSEGAKRLAVPVPGAPGLAPLQWKAVAGATQYRVRVYRKGSPAPLLELSTTIPLAELPPAWVEEDGTRRSFTPGSYRWEVLALGLDRAGAGASTAAVARTGSFRLEPPR